jgi:pyridoxamine 5'-phosphate oxidase
MNTRIESLQLIQTACWRELQRAATERGHAWRTLTLATTDGEAGHARIVILREVDARSRSLLMYTDARSAKVAQIGAHPLGTLVGWSPVLSWQLRLKVKLSAQSDGLAATSRWARLKLTPSAQDYLSQEAPGTVLTSFETQRATRAHFAVIVAEVLHIDWLELHPEGHRRAAFEGNDAHWLQP